MPSNPHQAFPHRKKQMAIWIMHIKELSRDRTAQAELDDKKSEYIPQSIIDKPALHYSFFTGRERKRGSN